jgi:hypothetical protein
MQTCTGVVGVVVFLITRDCTVVGKTLRPPSSSLESRFYFEFIFLPRFVHGRSFIFGLSSSRQFLWAADTIGMFHL